MFVLSRNKYMQADDLQMLHETAFQHKLNFEASEAARYMLEEKLALACSELNADKEFYHKQLQKLEYVSTIYKVLRLIRS